MCLVSPAPDFVSCVKAFCLLGSLWARSFCPLYREFIIFSNSFEGISISRNKEKPLDLRASFYCLAILQVNRSCQLYLVGIGAVFSGLILSRNQHINEQTLLVAVCASLDGNKPQLQLQSRTGRRCQYALNLGPEVGDGMVVGKGSNHAGYETQRSYF